MSLDIRRNRHFNIFFLHSICMPSFLSMIIFKHYLPQISDTLISDINVRTLFSNSDKISEIGKMDVEICEP